MMSDAGWEDHAPDGLRLTRKSIGAICMVLIVVSILVGEPYLSVMGIALFPTLLGSRQALARSRARSRLRSPRFENELEALDARDLGADFLKDFFAALPQMLLVAFFGWSLAWAIKWTDAVVAGASLVGLGIASATLVAHLTEGVSRLVMLSRGRVAVRAIESERTEQEDTRRIEGSRPDVEQAS